jgi:hypothetical protein
MISTTVPNVVGSYAINFPCFSGIVVVPGSVQTLAVSFNEARLPRLSRCGHAFPEYCDAL